MLHEIKSWVTGKVLFSLDCASIKLCTEAAVKANVSLRDADLRDADLRDADLRNADLRDANLRDANLSDANLSDANLRNANLRDADLRDANLSDANNIRLPTGETFTEYVSETLPALLSAGGKPLDSFEKSWECHDWRNCPMHHAFDAENIQDVPLLLRPHAEQFVKLFDANQLPWNLVKPALDAAMEAK